MPLKHHSSSVGPMFMWIALCSQLSSNDSPPVKDADHYITGGMFWEVELSLGHCLKAGEHGHFNIYSWCTKNTRNTPKSFEVLPEWASSFTMQVHSGIDVLHFLPAQPSNMALVLFDCPDAVSWDVQKYLVPKGMWFLCCSGARQWSSNTSRHL